MHRRSSRDLGLIDFCFRGVDHSRYHQSMRLSPSHPLFYLAALLCSCFCLSCGSDGTWRSQIAGGWAESNYKLSQQESARLKHEARLAKENGNREVCGAIFQRQDGSLELCFANNESVRAHTYLLSPKSVQRIQRLAKDTKSTVIGSFHSHPSSDAQPGEGDLKHAGIHSLMLIHSVRTNETKLWKVVLREDRKKAREVQLKVFARRPRSASPLAPSPSKPIPDHLKSGRLDLRTP